MPADGQDNEEQDSHELATQSLKAGENKQCNGGVSHGTLRSQEIAESSALTP